MFTKKCKALFRVLEKEEKMNLIKNYIRSHKHILFVLYVPFYFLWFTALEKWTDRNWTILHSTLDDSIPFIPLFIIPYYIWFIFVIFFCIYFYIKMPVQNTIKLYSALTISMTITLIIYTVWPNALELRPVHLDENDIFSTMVERLYGFDTSTNVCPSLHVLNTLTITFAYFISGKFKGRHLLNMVMIILPLSICASTVFLKQHSIIDIYAAIALFAVYTPIIYIPKWEKVFSKKAPANCSGKEGTSSDS